MDEGKLRKIDPNLAVWSFFGPFAARMLSKRILNVAPPVLPDAEGLIEAHVTTFLRGMRND
jgi:hypothetical protein